jgi:hypothetical protein
MRARISFVYRHFRCFCSLCSIDLLFRCVSFFALMWFVGCAHEVAKPVEKAEASESKVMPPAAADAAPSAAHQPASEITVQRMPAEPPAESESDGKGAGTAPAAGSPAPTTDGVSPHPAGPRRAPRRRKPVPDAATTVKNVGALLEQVRQARKQQDYGKALRLATEAWDATRRYPNDPQLMGLAEDVSREINAVASLANAKAEASAALSSTRLIDK